MRRFYDPGRGDVVLNPFDERSVKWDLFAEIKTPYDVDQLARSLIPDQDGSDRSWRAYARTFFTAVTRQAHDAGVTDVAELYRLLVAADARELRAMVYATPAQPFLEEHNSRMFDSIRSVTSSAVGALEYVSKQQGADFSVRRWVAERRPGVLFMPYKAGQIAGLRSAISGWMRLAVFETMDGPSESTAEFGDDESRRLWFVVDELDALGQIDGLKDALARLRKFGGRCVLGFQSIAQVSTTYGQGDAHTIVENCGNTLILRCSASEGGGTARFASQLIGDREVIRTTLSRNRRPNEVFDSTSLTQHYTVESAVLASEIEQLPDLTGYLKHASDPEWRRVRFEAVRRWDRYRSVPPPGARRSPVVDAVKGRGIDQ
jgi:type IV secretory pathway TraG/TraD family ATPase VirD4